MSNLIIGIGSSGLRIIEELQQYHYEYTGKNKPGASTEYLYIETDVNRTPRRTANGNSDITPVFFDFNDISVDINILRNENNPAKEWVPPVEYLNASHSGAGGMPSFGRLSLWKTNNYTRICNILEEKFQKIGGNSETKILIVGTLTGGTCSGMCVDFAYLLHSLFPDNIPNINALFLIPKTHGGAGQEVHAYHENFFSAISAITHYNKIDTVFKAKFPSGNEFTTMTPPYQLVNLLSQEFNNGNADIRGLDELYKLAGFNVMLRILGSNGEQDVTFQEVLDRRDVDRQSTANYKFVTSGIKLIQYPKGQLKELLSIELAIKEFRQLIDNEKFLDRTKTFKNIENFAINFRNNAQKEFEDLVSDSFSTLNAIQTSNDVSILDDFDIKLKEIEELNVDEFDKAVFKAFSTIQPNNYFEITKNNKNLLIDDLVSSIQDYIKQKTNFYKNLSISSIFLEEISNHISVLLDFYKEEYNIDGNDDKWNHTLGLTIEKHLATQLESNVVFQNKRYKSAVFKDVFALLKMHLSVGILSKIQEQINSAEKHLSPRGHELPTLQSLRKTSSKISSLINGNEDSPNMLTIHRRKNEITSILNESSTCYSMLFEGKNASVDIDSAISTLLRKGLSIDLNKMCDNNVWSFISKESDAMYSEILKNSNGFVNENDVISSNLKDILSANVPSVVSDLLQSNKDGLRDKIPAMLKLVNGKFAFNFHHCSHLHFISSDNSMYLPLFNNLQTTEDGSTSISLLTDTIVFYQEYENMSDMNDISFEPIHHLRSFVQTKADILNKINSKTGKEFLIKKSPYLTDSEFKQFLL